MIRIQKFRIYLHVKMHRKNLCESKYVKRKKKQINGIEFFRCQKIWIELRRSEKFLKYLCHIYFV